MSVDSGSQEVRDMDGKLSEALVSLCRLSSDAVDQIEESMRAMRMTFADAALHLGLVTAAEVAEALARVRRRTYLESPGVIEAVLRRHARDRKPKVWHTDYVKPCEELLIAHAPDHSRSETIRALRTKLL